MGRVREDLWGLVHQTLWGQRQWPVGCQAACAHCYPEP